MEKSCQIEVNKVYEIQRFKILPSRTLYKLVDAALMIQFTVYTQLHIVHDPPDTFPSYIYRVTYFDHVADIVGQTDKFIGKIRFPLSYNIFL
jgi:hypothetical protein